MAIHRARRLLEGNLSLAAAEAEMEIQSPALVAAMKEIRSAVDPLFCVFKVGNHPKQMSLRVKDSKGDVRYKREALWVADLEKLSFRRDLIDEIRSNLGAQGIILPPWPSA